MNLTVQPVKHCLQPITLLDRGQVTRIYGKAYVAGVLPIKVGIIFIIFIM